MTVKHNTLLSIVAAVILFFPFTLSAEESADITKAKEYMQAAMYPQAATLLEKAIYDTPTNPEAHFQLGVCYLKLNEFKAADARFASAVKLDPDYEPRVARELNRSSVKKDKQKAKDDQLKRNVRDVKKMLNLD